MKNKEKFVLTMKLLADESGKKMGKSEGNVVFLNEKAKDIYGKVMSWPDGVMSVAFELCTQLDWQEVKNIQKDIKEEKVNPRDLKMKLAKEITRIIKNDKEADLAEDYFIKTIQRKQAPDDVKNLSLGKDKLNVLDLLVFSELVSSKGEARRLIKQKGLKLDGVIVDSSDLDIDLNKERLIQKGKRHFLKVKK